MVQKAKNRSIRLVQTAADLEEVVPIIAGAKELAIDLEFDKNRFRYGFNLCLMQIAAGDVCFVIDPLAQGVKVDPLFPVLENPEVDKLVFAFGEDLRLLHYLGCFPKGLSDLKTATSLLNYPPASLTNLLDEILDVQLGQSAQNSNWFKRPLTENQVEYAADDVRYLQALKVRVMKEARQRGIEAWVEEENAYLDTLSYADVANNEMYRTKDKLGQSEFDWFVLKRLFEFREKLAQKVNRPSYQIFHKDFLTELAKDSSAIRKWNSVKGIHRAVNNSKVRSQLQAELDAAVRDAKAQNKSKSELAIPKPSPEETRRRRAEKAEMERVKQQVFAPLKKKLIADYGENAATFMLSNRVIMDIIGGDKSSLRNYKRELLEKYAGELGLDVEQYL